MKIGITGASGFVGGNLVRRLLRGDYQIRALAHNNHETLDGLDIEVVQGDILRPETLVDFCKDLDVVFHLAGFISIGGDPVKKLYQINVEGTKNLVNACKSAGVKRFIHFSTIHAFETTPANKMLNEKRKLATKSSSPYEHSKAIAEKWVIEQQSENFDVIVLNPTAIIGPNDFKPSLTGELFVKVCQGNLPALVPGGYNWVDVRDVCDGAISAITKGKGGEHYILSGQWKSAVDLVKMISKENGKEIKTPVFPFWAAQIGLPFIWLYSKISGSKPLYTFESIKILKFGNLKISNAKARKVLGYGPRPLIESVRDTLDWLHENQLIK
ncbi:MAG TPA: NAD-dependent epimerase/dehydratase family protein [Bacteroidales bacterium]